MINDIRKYTGVEIAIIGMAGRFPGSDDVDGFWENLKNGIETISFFSDEELLKAGVSAKMLDNKQYIKANSYLKNKAHFDSGFFGYVPAEAALMDPQMRLFHETCWEALEDAGFDFDNNDDKAGLFAGGTPNNNWENFAILTNLESKVDEFTALQIRNISYVCSRVSYRLNLQGPSIYLNTACSTSLVAIQRACMSLLLRECKVALAGGVSIKNNSESGYLYKEGMVSSPDGHCRAFDIAAQGTIEGEGVGVVVLKKLDDAIADGDQIHAIILGSGINNDGSRKISYTAPSIDGQYQCILKALKMARVPAKSISYVEAHGTGTPLGDPNEVEALNLAFENNPEKVCALGSVKTNMGHLDTAAGVAGLIKTVLSLKNKAIPPSLNFEVANPRINFDKGPFYVNTELRPWEAGDTPRRAGVSSFGIGGTNAHIILEEAPANKVSSTGRPFNLLVFSAKSGSALQHYINKFADFLERKKDLNLADIAYTLHTGRATFDYRKAFVCADSGEALQLLRDPEILSGLQPIPNIQDRSTVFMFPGQGSQYNGMCQNLYPQEVVFRRELDICLQIIKRLSGEDLAPMLFRGENETRLHQTEYTQPALFAVEYALAKLLMAWGIAPSTMVGHSLGEYVAACLSDVFTLEDALGLVIKRGALMQKVRPGTMMSIAISKPGLIELLGNNTIISIAAINSANFCVVSGNTEAIEEFKEHLESKNYKATLLRTSHAFHSYMMNDIADEFREAVSKVKKNPQKIPVISNLTGQRIADKEFAKDDYWVNHMLNPVLFENCVTTICKTENINFIEVGPGRTLSTFVLSNSNRTLNHHVFNVVRPASEKADDLQYILSAVGSLWAKGNHVPVTGLHDIVNRRKVSLPTYAFEKNEYPVNVDASQMISKMISSGSSLKDPDHSTWYYVPNWKLLSKSPQPFQPSQSRGLTILFADDSGICKSLSQKLINSGDRVVFVDQGNVFLEISPMSYQVNPGQELDYLQLFERIAANNLSPDRIIHGWGITTDHEPEYTDANCAAYFYSLKNIIGLCSKHFGLHNQNIIVLTNDLHPVLYNGISHAAKALSLALLKVIAREQPTLKAVHIDISLDENTNNELIENLYESIVSGESGDVISIRHKIIWKQTFDQIIPRTRNDLPVIKQNGVYVITGGLGELGFALTRYLLRRYKAKVVIIGRSALFDNSNSGPERDKKQKRVEELRAEGTVLYMDCDLADVVAVSGAITFAENRFGKINGLVHAAGVTHGPSIAPVNELSEDDFNNQFAPKILGLHTLKEIFGPGELDFCMLTSSLSTITGGLGLGAYAPANIYMDYYVRTYRKNGQLKNWINVNFDTLNFKGDDTGGINTDEFMLVFEDLLLMTDRPQVLVSMISPERKLRVGLPEIIVPNTGDGELNQKSDNDIGQAMVALWQSYFGVTGLEANADFYELGGDSLKALTMIAYIHKIFGAEISVADFFNHLTIAKLSGLIKEKINNVLTGGRKFIEIKKAELRDHYPLSSAQKRMFFLQESDKSTVAYNMPEVVKLEGDLDKDRLTAAFHELLLRHEVLRTSFEQIEGEVVQVIQEAPVFEIDFLRSSETAVPVIIADFIAPFDLTKGSPFRVGIVKINAMTHILMVDMHHIIADGVSHAVLIKDFMALYNGEMLPKLTIQYKDYAVWQQSKEKKTSLDKQRDFWLAEFAEEPGKLRLPADHQRPILKSYQGSSITFDVSIEDSKKLHLLADRESCTPFIVLLSIFNVFLAKLSNQEDIVVGTVIAGRQHADLSQMIGMFVNTLAIRNYPKRDVTFLEFLRTVKNKTLLCFDNQQYQYEDLIEDLNDERDTSRNPLFDIVFSYQNFETANLKIPNLEITEYSRAHPVSKFDLTLTADNNNNAQLFLNFEYCTEIFEKTTIQRFITYFKRLFSLIVQNTDRRIGDFGLLDEMEINELVNHYKIVKINFKPDAVEFTTRAIEPGNLDNGQNKAENIPIANPDFLILDHSGHLSPWGAEGELFITHEVAELAGPISGVPPGKKAIGFPFFEGEKIYCTGDIVKGLPDGTIGYVRRTKNEIRSHGDIVYLVEIERHLMLHPDIYDCIVVTKATEGEIILIAYCVSFKTFDRSELNDYLSQVISTDAFPEYYVFLDEMPRSRSGKIMANRLPNPTRAVILPSDEIETALSDIWGDVFRLDGKNISIDDNFFALGLQSLKATQLIYKIGKTFQSKISLMDVFKSPSIRGIAEFLRSEKGITEDDDQLLTKAPSDSEYYNVTYLQEREFRAMEISPERFYNTTSVAVVGRIQKDVLNKAVGYLIERHESLRTVYSAVDGTVKQKVIPMGNINYEVEFVDLSDTDEKEQKLAAYMECSFKKVFDFENGPMLDIKLIDIDPENNYLLISMPHANVDASSMEILKSDLLILYNSISEGKTPVLPEIDFQYKDYAAWNNKLFNGKYGALSRAFNLQKIGDSLKAEYGVDRLDDIIVHETYKDRLISELQALLKKQDIGEHTRLIGLVGKLNTTPGSSYAFFVQKDLLEKLKEMAAVCHASFFAVLVSTFSIVFKALTNKQQIRVDIPVSNRDREEFGQVTGWLMGSIIACIDVNGSLTLKELIDMVSRCIHETSASRYFSLERIQQHFNLPLEIIVPFQLNLIVSAEREIQEFKPSHSDEDLDAYYTIGCAIHECKNGLIIYCAYANDIYNAQMIESAFTQYIDLMSSSLFKPDTRVETLVSQFYQKAFTN